ADSRFQFTGCGVSGTSASLTCGGPSNTSGSSSSGPSPLVGSVPGGSVSGVWSVMMLGSRRSQADGRGLRCLGGPGVQDTEQQRLHPAEPLWRRSIEAERDQLVQPRHQHSRAIFTDVEYLRGLGVQLLSEVSRIEPVSQDRCVLPEHLVDDVVSIEV